MVCRSLVWMIAAGLTGVPALAWAQDDQPAPGLFARDSLTGGWFGAAADLKEHGIAIGATEISEVFGILAGGNRQGTIYDGRLELDLDADLSDVVENTVLHANAFQIHGRGLSANYLGNNAATISNIEATRATRLFDLWVEHQFLNGALSLRIGQIAADDEFFTSQNTGGFINSTFGWPTIMGAAPLNGGPAYPVATPGLRLRYAVTNAVVIQAAIFNGDPAGGDPGSSNGNSQLSNANGLKFPFDHGPFMIAEVSYSPGAESEPNPTTVYKAGIWRQGGRVDDLSVDASGRSLAAPGAGRPRSYDGDYGGYVVADRQLYKLDQDRALSAFLRLSAAPASHSPISFYVDGGMALKGPFADRPDDLMSFGVGYSQTSGAVNDLIHAQQRYAGSANSVSGFEALIELNYELVIAPWWSVQPDLQYLFHPTNQPVRPSPSVTIPQIHNALVAGLRTSIRF